MFQLPGFYHFFLFLKAKKGGKPSSFNQIVIVVMFKSLTSWNQIVVNEVMKQKILCGLYFLGTKLKIIHLGSHQVDHEVYPPKDQQGTWEYGPGPLEEDNHSKPSFAGSMLNLRGWNNLLLNSDSIIFPLLEGLVNRPQKNVPMHGLKRKAKSGKNFYKWPSLTSTILIQWIDIFRCYIFV